VSQTSPVRLFLSDTLGAGLCEGIDPHQKPPGTPGSGRRNANELGAFEFVSKPVGFDLLKEQLRQLPARRTEPSV
jgi:hypothetical protein